MSLVLGVSVVLAVAALAAASAWNPRDVEAAEWGRTLLGMMGGALFGYAVGRRNKSPTDSRAGERE